MRFAITGIDRYLGVFEAFVRSGWQPVKLFTAPVGHYSRDSNHGIMAYAEQLGAAIQTSQMTEVDLADLRARGCEVLIVAGYKWRIGDWQPYLKHAVNFHASPLPEGRGPYPVVRAILERRSSWAVTCHKIVQKFDRGDILAAQDFPMTDDECHESMDLKVQIAARRLATTVAGNFQSLWNSAKPQEAGSYWPLWKPMDRKIDFQKSVDEIMRHVRAFGLLESLAYVNNRWLSVRRAVGWVEHTGIASGQVVHIFGRQIVMAVQDGFVALIEWDFVTEEAVAKLSA